MNDFGALSPVIAVLVGLLAILGATLALIGSLGLLRLPTFYERVHPPTMGTTAGVVLTLAASMLLFSTLESRLVIHEIAIAVFTIVTTPVTYLMLVRAAARRDGIAGDPLDARATRALDTDAADPSTDPFTPKEQR
jgi:multicomponent K+:H+ antiporter subunit G